MEITLEVLRKMIFEERAELNRLIDVHKKGVTEVMTLRENYKRMDDKGSREAKRTYYEMKTLQERLDKLSEIIELTKLIIDDYRKDLRVIS